MASNKNQHYVPQCYLRQFSHEQSNASICLYNLDRKRLIKSAPIKRQCSKSYFYGDDLKLEKALQPIEGGYSALVKKISSPTYVINEKDNSFLLNFWLLQYMRTEAASKRSVEMMDGICEIAGTGDYKMQLAEAVQQSMRTFIEIRDIVGDMKVCFLKNKTKISFYTSDDPAVMTNRWHLFDRRAKGQTFGIGSAGNLFILPLTPSLLMLAYDRDVYYIPSKNGWIYLKDVNDVNALNSLQFNNCRANIYTHSDLNEENIVYLHKVTKNIRPEVKHKFTYAILDQVKGGEKRYKVINKQEAEEHQEALIHCQPVQVPPYRWPKQIKWKLNGFVVTNGTGLGFIRQAYALQSGSSGFYKVKVRK